MFHLYTTTDTSIHFITTVIVEFIDLQNVLKIGKI